MSGKYTTKNRKRKNRKMRPVLIAAVILLSIALVLSLLLVVYLEHRDIENTPQGTTEDQVPPATAGTSTGTNPAQPSASNTTVPTTSGATAPSTSEEVCLFELDNGVKIIGMMPYTGAFMEDRTDEVVTDVLGIQVKNTGETYIQTMDITLTAGEIQAQFSLSTLFPGETVVALEKNRMAYSSAPEFEQATAGSAVLFDGHPGMCEDKLKIQCLNGVINVTNISDKDITGDILIYYKNYVSGMYYGGITYRILIAGGLKAGQIHQGMAAHFNPDNSAVVFVTCG